MPPAGSLEFRRTVGKIFPRQATVMGAESLIALLASANSG
jgi:hypothetical protein